MASVGIRLFGGVAVARDGVAASRRSRTHATLLALLALQAGQAVDGDALIDEAWGADLPKHPRGALQVALTRLRDWLGDRPEPWITASGGLYTLHVAPDAVDLLAFGRLADAALRGGDLAAHEAARAAWRGTPFLGLDSDRLVEARRAAEERRRAVTVRHVALLLDAGRSGDVVDLLVGEDRLDEELSALLVRALRDGGRHREAVETYLDVRRRLRDELDVEPGPELLSLYGSLTTPRPAADPGRAPELVGRDDLATTILDALHGDGRLIVLHGRAGAGKTAVLRAVAHAARARGARTASSAWGENDVPAAPWHEVIDDLEIRGPAPDRDLGPWLHVRLGDRARDAPVLLALDDAHRADSASLDVLRALARRGLPAGVVVVVAARAPDTAPHPRWDRALAELGGHDGVVTRAVGPLAPEAVAVLVRRRLAALEPDDDLAAAVAHRSGGLALHVTALLDLLARCRTREEARDAVADVPDQVRAVVDHQAAQLPAATRRAVEALAVLRPIDLTGLAGVLGRRPLEVADDLEPAVRAGLLTGEGDRYVLRHDLDADGLRAGVPAVRAAHLHLARLEALDDDADAFTVLRHTDGAATLLAPDRLAAAQVEAGVASYRRRAIPEALALFAAAEPSAVDGPRARLLGHRALCLSAVQGTDEDAAGDVDLDDVLDDALDAALAVGDDELAVLVAIGDEPLGLSVQGDPRRYARLHRLLDRPLGPRLRLDLLVATVREASATAQDGAPALVAEAKALADAVAGDDPEARARVRALEARHLVDGRFPGLERLAIAADAHRLAVATGDPSLHLDGTELLMTAELTVGHTERAHKLRVELETAAERWFRPRSIWAAQVTEAAMLLAEGDPGADAAASRAAERGQALGLPAAPYAAGAHLLVQHLLLGTVADLAPLAAHASTQALNTAAWSAAAAYAAACGGHGDQAREHLAEYARRAAHPAMWFIRAAAAMAAAAAFRLGDASVAAHVREVLPADPDTAVLVGFGGAVLGPATLWTGVAARTVGDLDVAEREWSMAVALAERAGWTPWAAAARQCLTASADPDQPFPLGLGRPPHP